MTTTWAYWAIQRPDGTSHSQGIGVMMSKDGREVATTDISCTVMTSVFRTFNAIDLGNTITFGAPHHRMI